MLKTIGYIRVSTVKQADEGVSLEAQRMAIIGYCRTQSLPEPEIISDEGASGGTTAREGFRLLEGLLGGKGEPIVLIVYELSRLSRSVADSLAFVKKYVDGGRVSLVSLRDAFSIKTPSERAFFQLQTVFSEWFLNEQKSKTKAALAFKRSQGEKTGGYVPFGYNCADGRLTPNDSETAAIGLMVELRTGGASYRAICQALSQRKIPARGGGRWHPQVVSSVLKRRNLG